jgi:hypothetical protein
LIFQVNLRPAMLFSAIMFPSAAHIASMDSGRRVIEYHLNDIALQDLLEHFLRTELRMRAHMSRTIQILETLPLFLELQ